MSPDAIVRTSVDRGLQMIAICDHNSAQNVEAVQDAAEGIGLAVLPGLEVCSVEEVHLVALFEESSQALAMQQTVFDNLSGENDEELFGLQVVVNAASEVLRLNSRLLIGATSLSLSDLVKRIHDLGGLAAAAHVDREAFGIIGQLGFIPPDLPLDALEVTARWTPPPGGEHSFGSFPLLRSSDAHRPKEIGRGCSVLVLESPTWAELRMALARQAGREIVDPPQLG